PKIPRMGEPAQNPAPPKKRRRHWLIVALLLVLVSAVAWWNWPRIDPTLVGKWRVSANDKDRSFGQLWLKTDGTGLVLVREKRGESFVVRSYGFDWRVEGNSFAVLVQNRSGFPWWDRALRHAYLYTKSPIFL